MQILSSQALGIRMLTVVEAHEFIMLAHFSGDHQDSTPSGAFLGTRHC